MPEIGRPAPDFTLPAHTGGTVTLSALRGTPVVVAFFPLAFSGVCTRQFTELAAERHACSAEGAAVLAVSVDHANPQAAVAEATGAEGVTFLSDLLPRGEVARHYDVWVEERGHSIRASFVIDRDGILRDAVIPPTPLEIPAGEQVRGALRACAV